MIVREGAWESGKFQSTKKHPMIRNLIPLNWLGIYDDARFEIITSLGRLTGGKKRTHPGERYLHLGCGERIIPGFLNTDVFSNRKAQRGVDLRYPLPFTDQAFSGIYAHHVVEHVSYADARRLFVEARRVLVPGGVFRIVVPDLAKFIQCYTADHAAVVGSAALLPEWHRSPEWVTALEVMDHLFRGDYFNKHRSAWDRETLVSRLKEAGFGRVEETKCGESECELMRGLDNPNWELHSVYVEAFA